MANQWLNPLGALSQKENKVGGTNVSTYQYVVNALGQRASVNTSGTAFATAPADWLWLYNLRGELASARQTQTAAASRFYEFDGIGNRLRQRAGVFADAGGTLTGYTAIGTGPAVAPACDFDGNMTSGPLPIAPTVGTALVWDGENRLREVGTPVRYLYDALGRRVMKTITGATAPRTYAIYDGWNLLAEYTGPVHTTGTPPAVTLQRSYAWGSDLSGSMQGAGGVGGLLAAQLHTGGNAGVYYPTYDGNGNVSEYLDNNGDVKAHYEYGPFGEPLTTPAGVGLELPFRFSTKYQDAETGLLYYGYRYYDPITGRWLSKDPIEEEGGLNLYGMTGNSAVNLIDILGLAEIYLKIDENVAHKKSDEAATGCNTHVMVAFTEGSPNWTPAEGDISAPANVAKPNATYKELYMLLVTKQNRHWDSNNPKAMFPPKSKPGRGSYEPHLKQVYKLTVDNNGKIDFKADAGNEWKIQSEGIVNGKGSSLGSQIQLKFSSYALQWMYSGSAGWSTQGIVDHTNTGEKQLPAEVMAQFIVKGTGRGNHVTDNEGNKIGNPDGRENVVLRGNVYATCDH